MYFRRVRKLDLPAALQKQLVQQIELQKLTATGMNGFYAKIPLEELQEKWRKQNLDEDQQKYFSQVHSKAFIKGFTLENNIDSDLYHYYQSFLKLVPDEPKIILKFINSSNGMTAMHNDRVPAASLTCVISGAGPETSWYKPKKEYIQNFITEEDVDYSYKKGIIAYPKHWEKVTSIVLNPWEMVLFDHNAVHQVTNIPSNFTRILFSIGFANTSQTTLEDIYDVWVTRKH